MSKNCVPVYSKKPTVKFPVAHRLSADLRIMSRNLGAGSRLPTTRELCKMFKTSLATVSTVLAELESQNIIVRRHGDGVYVAPTVHQSSIAVLLLSTFFADTDVSPFWPLIWGTLTKALNTRSYSGSERHLYHIMTPIKEGYDHDIDTLTRLLQRNDVQYVLSIGIHGNNSGRTHDWLLSGKPPVISYAGAGLSTVQLNIDTIVNRAVPILKEEGCKRIELWRIFPNDSVDEGMWKDLELDFIKNAVHSGYAGDQFLVRDLRSAIESLRLNPKPTSYDQGFVLAQRAFADPSSRPDGIVIMDDVATSGAITALNQLGVKLRTDVKIATLAIQGSQILHDYENNLIRFVFNPKDVVDSLLSQLDELILRGPKALSAYVFIDPQLEKYTSRPIPLLSQTISQLL